MRILLFLLCCWPLAAVAGGAQINAVDVGVHKGFTRVTLAVSKPITHKIFTLSKPGRVVVDINNAKLAAALPKGAGVIRDFRSGRHGHGVRIVLDLAAHGTPRSFFLPARAGRPARLVVDVYSQASHSTQSVATAHSKAKSKRDIVIAVDAGHGGFDPGAHGLHGLLEKDITLQISKRLAAMINAVPGMRAVLTRSDDRYLKLRQRTAIARAHGADMFISVHCNSSKYASAHGGAVFALSQHGATSEAARWLAHRENDADKLGGVALADKSNMLASVLLDLSQTATINASLQVGKAVLHHMGQFESLRRHKVEQAAFVVLKSPDIPSVLVETAFISNPKEARKLKNAAFQKRMARAIVKGVKRYYQQHPVTATMVARNDVSVRHYRITRGDTLSAIASRFNVSIKRIETVNGLDGSAIRVGQVLTIPAS